ncbi:DNA mismatch repair protein MutL, partial [Suhomyces tanzawaensis NRRL Y-17324]
ISSISHADINKLTSGQVIIDLKSIVKELVENSIDANSSKIDITFTNYGVDLISVSDNGMGIKLDDFSLLCLRSHTSKIVEFGDLDDLSTLGFRGEALNSLCSISQKMKIITSYTEDLSKKHILEFDRMGNLSNHEEKRIVVASSGTTVMIEKIFSNLPVRHKNFIKHTKREFHKAISFLTYYILIYPEIKFTVNNITVKKNEVLVSRGGPKSSILDNMLTIFGTNGTRGLIPIAIQINDDIKIEGYISNHSFGMGRSVQDRQFLFINRRPIVHKKLQKVINETYKQFNHLQFPVLVLNLRVKPHKLDVNVTPDKTLIMIHDELHQLDLIRSEMVKFFELQDNLVPKNLTQNSSVERPVSRKDQEHGAKKCTVNQNVFRDLDIQGDPALMKQTSKVKNSSPSNIQGNANIQEPDSPPTVQDEMEGLDSEAITIKPGTKRKRSQFDSDPLENTIKTGTLDFSPDSRLKIFSDAVNSESPPATGYFPELERIATSVTTRNKIGNDNKRVKKDDKVHNLTCLMDSKCLIFEEPNTKGIESKNCKKQIYIDNIESHQEQEKKLTYIIAKKDFLRMKLIGQFNLGFILVSLNDQNLFILDQHASDEKYNFEKLNREFQFEHQRLIVPKFIQLSVIDEMQVIENQDVFKANGFEFEIEDSAKPGSRIKLLSLPVLKNHTFDEDDFHELIDLINVNHGNGYVRCSKIRSILAMRACRSSIMIGQSLSKKRMGNVVKSLGALEKPWNCPHGRPTMRHLIELENWKTTVPDYAL